MPQGVNFAVPIPEPLPNQLEGMDAEARETPFRHTADLLTPRPSFRSFHSASERYGRVNYLTPANQRLREFWPRSGVGGYENEV